MVWQFGVSAFQLPGALAAWCFGVSAAQCFGVSAVRRFGNSGFPLPGLYGSFGRSLILPFLTQGRIRIHPLVIYRFLVLPGMTGQKENMKSVFEQAPFRKKNGKRFLSAFCMFRGAGSKERSGAGSGESKNRSGCRATGRPDTKPVTGCGLRNRLPVIPDAKCGLRNRLPVTPDAKYGLRNRLPVIPDAKYGLRNRRYEYRQGRGHFSAAGKIAPAAGYVKQTGGPGKKKRDYCYSSK